MAELEKIVQEIAVSGEDDVISAFSNIAKVGVEAFERLAEACGPVGEAIAKLGGVALGVVTTMGIWAKASADAVHALDDLSKQTGESVENISALQAALGAMGADVGRLGSAMARLGPQMAKAWDQAKESIADAADKAAEAQSKVEHAQARLFKAQDEYAKAMGQPGHSEVEKRLEKEREATQALADAQRGLAEAQKAADKERKNSMEAVSAAVEGVVKGQKSLADAGKDANLSVDNIFKGLLVNSKAAEENITDFKGSLSSLSGQAPQVKQFFHDLADYLHNSGDAMKNQALLNRLFGRSIAADLIGPLSQGGDAFDAQTERMKRLGFVIGEEDVKAAEKFRGAYGKLSEELAQTGKQIGIKFDPAFEKAMDHISNWVERNHGKILEIAEGVGEGLQAIGRFLLQVNRVGNELDQVYEAAMKRVEQWGQFTHQQIMHVIEGWELLINKVKEYLGWKDKGEGKKDLGKEGGRDDVKTPGQQPGQQQEPGLLGKIWEGLSTTFKNSVGAMGNSADNVTRELGNLAKAIAPPASAAEATAESMGKVPEPADATAKSLNKVPGAADATADSLGKVPEHADKAAEGLSGVHDPAHDAAESAGKASEGLDKIPEPAGNVADAAKDTADSLDKVPDKGDKLSDFFSELGGVVKECIDAIGGAISKLAQMLGFKSATKEAKAGGGAVEGIGSGTSDSNLIWASKGEFVVKADGSNLDEAIKHFGFRGYQRGGWVIDKDDKPQKEGTKADILNQTYLDERKKDDEYARKHNEEEKRKRKEAAEAIRKEDEQEVANRRAHRAATLHYSLRDTDNWSPISIEYAMGYADGGWIPPGGRDITPPSYHPGTTYRNGHKMTEEELDEDDERRRREREKERQEAEREAERQERERQRKAEEEQREAERKKREQEREAERQQRDAQRDAKRQESEAEKQAKKDAQDTKELTPQEKRQRDLEEIKKEDQDEVKRRQAKRQQDAQAAYSRQARMIQEAQAEAQFTAWTQRATSGLGFSAGLHHAESEWSRSLRGYAEGGPVNDPPLGAGAADFARGVRDYLEKGGRAAVSSVASAASQLWEQSKSSIENPTSPTEHLKTGLALTGLVGSMLPVSMAAQAAVVPGLEKAGFSPDDASKVADIAGLLANPTKGASLLTRMYLAGHAGLHIGEAVQSAQAQENVPHHAMGGVIGDERRDSPYTNGNNTLSYHQLDMRTDAGTFPAQVNSDTMDRIQSSALSGKLTRTGERPSWYS